MKQIQVLFCFQWIAELNIEVERACSNFLKNISDLNFFVTLYPMAHRNFTAAGDATSFPSSPSTSHCNTNSYVYDVFINHRGPDVKRGLASHVYRRIKDHGLRVFLDQQELEEGESMTAQIKGAIRTASVHVAIFSRGYANSRWCLDELLLMFESGSTILPVFYDVKPSDLRWTQGGDKAYPRPLSILLCILCTLVSILLCLPLSIIFVPLLSIILCVPLGISLCILLCVPVGTIILCIHLCTQVENGVYARGLRMLGKKKTFDPVTNIKKPRYDSVTIEKWRNALSNVSQISGFELNACNGDEGQLVDEIVQQVLKIVRRTPLNVAKFPTGLAEKVKDVEMTMSFQRQTGKPIMVGIVGLGGVGKTTLATELFNRERSNYHRSCFLFDVRSRPLASLQSILLKDLTPSNVPINSVKEGIEELKRHLSSSPQALMVLDDVDHIDQLDALLLPVKDTIHPDSLIIVTSRNKDVLTSSGIAESSIYKLNGLNPQHSQELFCSHAFGQPYPVVAGFDEVVEKFLDACNGLPLSLKVLGALLRGKDDLKYWNEQLQKTSEILPSDIESTLKISYDALNREEKQIFLDLACFFIGEEKDTAIRIWNGSRWAGWLGLWKLENRCLVEVDSENRLRMHDHLRDLGRYLAENPEYPRRLWRLTDNLLLNVSDQSPVRGISMVQGNGPEQSFENVAGSCNLARLQLLRAESHFVEQVFSAQLPPLIYLHWNNCPNSSLPPSIPLKNLRVLHIKRGRLKTLWQNESEAPVRLTELYIDAPVSKVPKSIGKLNSLEKFVLCNGELTCLPDSFGNLTGLKSLDLRWCFTLKTLPHSLGNLTGLHSLRLTGCSTLQMLPDSVGNLMGLQSLDLNRCFTLQTLPDSIGNLTGLQSLHLSSCSTLQTLPDSVGNLSGLQSLNLGGCSSLHMLPDSVGNLMGLQRLNLIGCCSMQMLPDSVGNLTSLQDLLLNSCPTLPDSIGNLRSLHRLHLGLCSTLQMLPESVGNLRGLQHLYLRGCSTLQTLPNSVGNLTGLQILDLGECTTLQVLPDSVGNLTGLQDLVLYRCSTLQKLPDSIGNLTSLRSLNLVGCSTLHTLPDSVGNLRGLQILHLSDCSALQTLPDSFGQLTGLRRLSLNGCSKLQMLLNVERLSSLETFSVYRCPELQLGAGVEQLRQRLGAFFFE